MPAERIHQTGRDSWHARTGYQYQQRNPAPIVSDEPMPYTSRWWGQFALLAGLIVIVVLVCAIVPAASDAPPASANSPVALEAGAGKGTQP